MRLARTTDLLTSCVASVSFFFFAFSFFAVGVVCPPPPPQETSSSIREELKELVDRYPRSSDVLLAAVTVGGVVKFFRWVWHTPHKWADPRSHGLYDLKGDERIVEQWRALTPDERALWWYFRRQLRRGGEATEKERKAFKRCLNHHGASQLMHIRYLLPLAEECVRQMHAKRLKNRLKMAERRGGKRRRRVVLDRLNRRRQRKQSDSASRTDGDTSTTQDSAGQQDSEPRDQGPSQFSKVEALLGTVGENFKRSFGGRDGVPKKGSAWGPALHGLRPAL
ncbi:MAG: hypothetical protein M1815_001086 [Lichina confinis]|nr:MAG: hypothetical protein M1815_001086 [Lichina confinis]